MPRRARAPTHTDHCDDGHCNMDGRGQAPHKSSSFSPATNRDDAGNANAKVDRKLSLDSARHDAARRDFQHHAEPQQIKEECEDDVDDGGNAGRRGGGGGGGAGGEDMGKLSMEIDAFLAAGKEGNVNLLPEATLERFASAVEDEIARSESSSSSVQDRWATGAHGEPRALLAAISRIAALASALGKSPEAGAGGKHAAGAHRITAVVQRAMAFLEDEFHALLEPKPAPAEKCENDRCVLQLVAPGDDSAPPYAAETVDRLRSMADAMVAAGYATECAQMFLVARRNAFDASLRALGYEKASVDDVARMSWEALEPEIATWTKAFRHATNVGLSKEHNLSTRVFTGRNAAVGRGLFADLARCVMLHMLSFTEAVAMTKRAAEKLFKVLDMYEAIRDASPVVDAFLSADTDDAGGGKNTTALAELKSEIAAARSRIGQSAAAIFCELESSIRADAGKQPVPGGAVHPLTRYVMNYLKYACEYNSTLEQVFREHHQHQRRTAAGAVDDNNPFAAQLMDVMELLHGNLESKSRLYKDPSLSNIFLMNNGRYMLQKIRGSPETNAMLGEAWARKQSTNLRQYHKNYQRETWSRVLTLLRDDGAITVKGSVQKPVLKDRFKHFNSAMDEIHRTQGAWVVSDEQLQSELRVSIAAVVVPAYRSFLGRFAQTLSAGRQSEKYIKLSADDVESIIDELFDGNAASMSRRR